MKSWIKYLGIGIVGGVISLAGYSLVEKPHVIKVYETSDSTPVVRTGNTTSVESPAVDFTYAAAHSVEAVVHVKTVYPGQTYYNPLGSFFGQPSYQTPPERGSGSGVIISPDGYIVTNNHVIDNAQDVEVTLNDNKSYKAKVVGADPGTDLALLKIDAKNLPTIPFGDSDHLKVGQWVLAVGNPFNLTSTVTAGIVSAKARNINILHYDPKKDQFPIESFIQTDAAVNPGNSGGALVDPDGNLVGINSAIASNTGSYAGYSFAIPVSIVKKVTNDLLEYGSVQRAYIGVNISNIDDALAKDNDLKTMQGAYVRSLLPESAAKKAGLEAGDVIVKLNDMPIKDVTELQEQVGKHNPGDKVTVEVLRNNQPKDFEVTLTNREGNTKVITPEEAAESAETASALGANLSKVSSDLMSKLGIKNGVEVSSLSDGKMQKSGMKKGFIITKIDNQPVASPAEVERILTSKQGGVLIEGVYPDGVTAYYGFGL